MCESAISEHCLNSLLTVSHRCFCSAERIVECGVTSDTGQIKGNAFPSLIIQRAFKNSKSQNSQKVKKKKKKKKM
jgi:hypothetical protein